MGRADPEFATCKLGKQQSPIDIRGAKAADLPAIKFDYQPSPLKVIDNGHTIQVNYAPGSSIDVGGTRYELVQFHFHKPSEEKIDGKSHAMVAHLVHKNADGKLAVVAVLLDKGGASDLIQRSGAHLPKQKEKEIARGRDDRRAKLLPPSGLLHLRGLADDAAVQRRRPWFVLKTPVSCRRPDRRVRQDLSDERAAGPAAQRPNGRDDSLRFLRRYSNHSIGSHDRTEMPTRFITVAPGSSWWMTSLPSTRSTHSRLPSLVSRTR